MIPIFEKISATLSLDEIQRILDQKEPDEGPLVQVGTDGEISVFTFDGQLDPPTNSSVLRAVTAGVAANLPDHDLICDGNIFVSGLLTHVAVFRIRRDMSSEPIGSEAASGVMTVSKEIPAEGRALLDTVATDEANSYNVIFGGRRFTDFSHHPNIAVPITSGPNKGKTSTAAGRYQFLFSTWTGLQEELDLPDFSPASQDKAAWHLAQTVYRKQEDRDLLSDLENGIFDKVAPALHNTWTSLPGGIEQGANANQFVMNYKHNLAKYK
jgi:muramidase (phage lysozyme)